MNAIIDTSAQFGGRDAADALLPHFKALKRAARSCAILDFAFPKFAFILRVNGEISSYGTSGVENVDFESSGKYVSVDIVVTIEDRKALETPESPNPIALGIRSTATFLETLSDRRLSQVDFVALGEALDQFAAAYCEQVKGANTVENASTST